MTRPGGALLLLAGLAGCVSAPSPPPKVEYLPPTTPPSEASGSFVQQPRELVWNQLIDRLNQSELTVERVDEARGVIVATYSGDPEPHVTCGWLVFYRPDELERIPAARRESRFDWPFEGGSVGVDRELTLDGRLVLEVEPANGDTVVAAESAYVLTKTVALVDPSGAPLGQDRELVEFKSGGSGRFEKGTVCQPTGALELAAMSALPRGSPVGALARQGGERPPPLGAPPQETVRTTRIDGQELDCAGVDRFYCDALEITASYREINQRRELGLDIETLDGGTTLVEGSLFGLAIDLPTFDSFLTVSYLQRDGTVGHVLDGTGQPWPANAQELLQDTGYEIAEPYGLEMVVAVASEVPLFPEPRPRFESAPAFLAALLERLNAIRIEHPDAQIAATHLFVTTRPREPLS